MSIVVVVPTCRPSMMDEFCKAWDSLLRKHRAYLITVLDGKVPSVSFNSDIAYNGVPEEWEGLIFSHTDAVRNLGFLYAVRYGCDCDVIITMDDDVRPYKDNDPIQEHLDALEMKVPISWFSTADRYMRGFPYGVREETAVWVSHGVWNGVHDYDGPTQLVLGNQPATFYKGPIPKGCLFPCCCMNLAFKVEALPWMYFAPMGKTLGVQRFADIWMGIEMKRALDTQGKAVVSGYSMVDHLRASNVFANLEQEAKGLSWNEEFWQRPLVVPEGAESYMDLYLKCRKKWIEVTTEMLKERS